VLRVLKDIAIGLVVALLVVLVVLFSTGQVERFVYGAF
jgi:uncharacterized membrane protein YgaE (UPF0421/DUF939 family)